DIVPTFNYDLSTPYFEITVPTLDTVRFSAILEQHILSEYPMLMTGVSGTGKSAIIAQLMREMDRDGHIVPIPVNFSAQTSSMRTQEMIEAKLDKKRKKLLGPPAGRKAVVFVDDLNMPELDRYGSQPPVELIRHLIDYDALYDRKDLFLK
ncbi:dynein heavy chain 6, axonemal, partial [Kipferlia bialata]